jgi:hypothetical protein
MLPHCLHRHSTAPRCIYATSRRIRSPICYIALVHSLTTSPSLLFSVTSLHIDTNMDHWFQTCISPLHISHGCRKRAIDAHDRMLKGRICRRTRMPRGSHCAHTSALVPLLAHLSLLETLLDASFLHNHQTKCNANCVSGEESQRSSTRMPSLRTRWVYSRSL